MEGESHQDDHEPGGEMTPVPTPATTSGAAAGQCPLPAGSRAGRTHAHGRDEGHGQSLRVKPRSVPLSHANSYVSVSHISPGNMNPLCWQDLFLSRLVHSLVLETTKGFVCLRKSEQVNSEENQRVLTRFLFLLSFSCVSFSPSLLLAPETVPCK